MKHLLFLLFIPFFSFAQTWVISGRVIENNQTPIPFASVYVNNTSIVTTADDKGNYSLSIPSRFKKVELAASFIGYKSAKTVIERGNGKNRTCTFQLTSSNVLSEVKVKGKMDKEWKKRWQIFANGLKGESPFTKNCLILNPEAVRLSYDNVRKQVIATATEPIILQNSALGFKILFHMDSFESDGEKTFFAGNKFFQEIPVEDQKAKNKQQRNRELAYRNSFRNFLVSLTQNQTKENGFELYTARRVSEVFLHRILLSQEILDGNFKELSAQDICFWNPETEQYILHSDRMLFIFALNRFDAKSVFVDRPYKYSRLLLPNGYLSFNENGWITAPNGMTMYDFWGQEGFSNLLPNDYIPSDAPPVDSLTTLQPIALKSQSLPMNFAAQRIQLSLRESMMAATVAQGVGYQRKESLKLEEKQTLVNLDYEVKIEERDNSRTVFDLLRRIPGLKVVFNGSGYSISFLGNNTNLDGSGDSTPGLDIDGQFSDDPAFVMETLNSLTVRQIRKIGVVKYGNSAAYGARGAKGIIVIQTVK